MTDFQNLLAEKCTPAKPGELALTAEASQALLSALDGWGLNDKNCIEKSFGFPDFLSALAFVNAIGGIAEEHGHHPDLYLGWGRVQVQLTTHDVGGLSRSDFILAAHIEQYALLAKEHSEASVEL